MKLLQQKYIVAVLCLVLLAGCGLVGASTETYDSSRVHASTIAEVMEFLAEDDVSNRTYDEHNYNCVNFAVDLWYNAYLAGLDAYLLAINRPGRKYHIVVGFYLNTQDVWDNWENYAGLQNWLFWNNGTAYSLVIEPQAHISADSLVAGCIPMSEFIDVTAAYHREDAYRLWLMGKGEAPLEYVRLAVKSLSFKIGSWLHG